jgi:hypothetical protein|tara:strand:+ start:893 stop:1168 length:276 start_codon:yes stop_codon:yes gene_type:complete
MIESIDEMMEPENLLEADNFRDAVIGVGQRCGQPNVLIYDVDKVIDILMTRDELSYEEAWDYYEYNMLGSWVGEKTPIWMERMEPNVLAHV